MQNHALHLASLAAEDEWMCERDRALEEVSQCVSMCPCVSPQPWPLVSIGAPRSPSPPPFETAIVFQTGLVSLKCSATCSAK